MGAGKGTTRTTPRSRFSQSPSKRIHKLTRVHAPSDSSLEAVLLEESGVVIGREPGPGGIAVDDDDASRRHAELTHLPQHDRWRVKDLGSKNGTFLDARQLTEPTFLQNGSVLRVGQTLLVYETLEPSEKIRGIHDCPVDRSLARYQAEALADIAAASAIPIVILGPTGAGKEVLAKRIHEKSGRAGQLVALNCATFNKELLPSELFGHRQGAFYGAHTDRPGLFRTAHGGTLFLDEIGELPLDQQASLLRVLEEKQVRPVGSDETIPVDVRLICATHRDLTTMERDGVFRGDVLGRIAGFVVSIPALAERRVEILPLFDSMLTERKRLSSPAAEALLVYAWPRNIRELKMVADNVSLFAANVDEISVGLLPSHIQSSLRPSPDELADSAPTRTALEGLLRDHGGNVAEVARALGKQRNQVYRWLKVHGLDAEDFRI